MNEPIISPTIIYLISIANDVKALLIAIGILAGLGTIVGITVKIGEYSAEYCREEATKTYEIIGRPLRKLAIILFVIFLPLGILIPTQNTIIAMIVAKQITPNNIKTTLKAGKSLKDELKQDIVDLLNGKITETDSATTQK